MNPKPKLGQPTNGDEAAMAHIHLRVTLARKNRYVRTAQREGKTLAAWMTDTCDKASADETAL